MSSYVQTLPAQAAAGATTTTYLGDDESTTDTGWAINAAELVPPPGYATINGAATNNVTFNIRQMRGGVFVQNVATLTLTAGTNLVAETPVPMAVLVSGPVTQRGDVFDCQMVQNGTGLAIAAGIECQLEVI